MADKRRLRLAVALREEPFSYAFAVIDHGGDWSSIAWNSALDYEPSTYLVTVPDAEDGSIDVVTHDGHEAVRVRVRPDDSGAITVTEVHLRTSERHLGERRVRQLGRDSLVRTVQAWARNEYVLGVLGELWEPVSAATPGRAGRPDLHYALWAQRYVEACGSDPRTPIRRIVADDNAAGKATTEAEVRAKLNRARERGLLTAAPSGKAGGTLTEKALELVDRKGSDDGQH